MRKILLIICVVICALTKPAVAQRITPEPTAKNDRWGYAYMNNGFRLAIPYIYDEADSFDAKLPRARVKINNQYYLIDLEGHQCVGPYNHISMWADPDTGYYIFTAASGKKGIINMDGAIIEEPKYSELNFNYDGNVWGILDGSYVEFSVINSK